MAELFDVQRQAITKHIKNIFETHELEEMATSSILELVQKEGRRSVKRIVTLYNLDMIISVGFRVNTHRGIQFRRWANQVLKDHLLKGFSLNHRLLTTGMQVESRFHEQQMAIESHSSRLDAQDARIKAVEDHIDFFVKSAKKSVVFIDPFADISVLKFAAMRAEGVSAKIYSARISHQFKEEADLHNKQYPGLELKNMRDVHDRFLLVDDTVYHFGASFKDMGAEFSAYCVLNFVTPAQVIEMVK